MKIKNKATTRSYNAPDAGIKVIVGMHASLQNAMYVGIPFLLMPDFVLIGKIILNPVPDGFTHHFANSLMTLVSETPAAMEENPQLVAARQALKQPRKFLKATVKEAKKQKT